MVIPPEHSSKMHAIFNRGEPMELRVIQAGVQVKGSWLISRISYQSNGGLLLTIVGTGPFSFDPVD